MCSNSENMPEYTKNVSVCSYLRMQAPREIQLMSIWLQLYGYQYRLIVASNSENETLSRTPLFFDVIEQLMIMVQKMQKVRESTPIFFFSVSIVYLVLTFSQL